MTAPTPPTVSIPQWCNTGAKVDPQLSQDVINTGWQVVPGQNYGQIPPFQWVNWTNNKVGQWLNYLAGPITSTTGAVPYIQAGKFDVGISVYNQQSVAFYDESNTNNVALAAADLVSSSVYILPPKYQQTDGQVLGCVGEQMNWQFGSVGNPTPTGFTGGIPTGFIGEFQTISASNISIPINGTETSVLTIPLSPGIWDISISVQFNFSPSSVQFGSFCQFYISQSSTSHNFANLQGNYFSLQMNTYLAATLIPTLGNGYTTLHIPKTRYVNVLGHSLYILASSYSTVNCQVFPVACSIRVG